MWPINVDIALFKIIGFSQIMSMKFTEIKLNNGERIQLQDPSSKTNDRIFVKLIGFRENMSILVTMPRVDGELIRVVKGQIFIVRLFSVQTVYAFNVTVLECKMGPYAYMHLSYPEKVESVVVRNAQRVNVELIVSVQSGDPDEVEVNTIPAKLTDISTGGAKLSTHKITGEVGDDISMTAKLTVGGVEQYLQILATIRRLDIDEDEGKQIFSYGLEFRFVEETDRLVLHGFVYEQLSKG